MRALPPGGVVVAVSSIRPASAAAGRSATSFAAFLRWNHRQMLWWQPFVHTALFTGVIQQRGRSALIRVYLRPKNGDPTQPLSLARQEVRRIQLASSGHPPAGMEIAGAVPMAPIPADVGTRCRSHPLMRPACPSLVPIGPYDDFTNSHVFYNGGLLGTPPGDPLIFNFAWWAENPPSPQFNRPPRFVHIIIFAKHGYLAHRSGLEPQFRWPAVQPAATIRDGDFTATRPRQPTSYGRVTWCGHAGTLTLIPLLTTNSIQGGHLIFHWHQGGADYALGLHSWEPFTETAATLHAIICSLPSPS